MTHFDFATPQKLFKMKYEIVHVILYYSLYSKPVFQVHLRVKYSHILITWMIALHVIEAKGSQQFPILLHLMTTTDYDGQPAVSQ